MSILQCNLHFHFFFSLCFFSQWLCLLPFSSHSFVGPFCTFSTFIKFAPLLWHSKIGPGCYFILICFGIFGIRRMIKKSENYSAASTFKSFQKCPHFLTRVYLNWQFFVTLLKLLHYIIRPSIVKKSDLFSKNYCCSETSNSEVTKYFADYFLVK